VALQAKAQAEAEAILVKAKAEAEAIRLKAAAEAERAEMLSKTALGQQQSLLAQYTDMVVGSNQGVEKIVYLDPSVNRDSPLPSEVSKTSIWTCTPSQKLGSRPERSTPI